MSAKKAPLVQRPPTSADVARAAGVSRTTVSYVLNSTAGQTIPAETRERVLAAARTLGYQVNASARALRKGFSDEIAYILPESMRSYMSASLVPEYVDTARELGYVLVIYPCGDAFSPAERKNVFESVLARRPAAIIAASYTLTATDYRRAGQLGMRTLIVGAVPLPGAPWVNVPTQQAAHLAGVHLAERGHRRVACIVPPAKGAFQKGYVHRGVVGLQSGLASADVQVIEHTLAGPGLAGARAAVEVLLRRPDPPTAMYCIRDDYSLLMLRSLSEAHVRIPEDVALVSMGDNEVCTLVTPALTSVKIDLHAIAANTLAIVDAMVHDRAPSADLFKPCLPQLIVRESG